MAGLGLSEQAFFDDVGIGPSRHEHLRLRFNGFRKAGHIFHRLDAGIYGATLRDMARHISRMHADLCLHWMGTLAQTNEAERGYEEQLDFYQALKIQDAPEWHRHM